jgi:NADP-dependent 3-hydroxy acid dehydrogenase YdfG
MQHELRAAEQGEYEQERYLRPATVAAAIGYVLRAPEDAVVASLDLRPRAIG